MELDEKEIMVGGRYRGRKPVKVTAQFRDVWDDRTVTWIAPNRLAVEYTFPHGSQISRAVTQMKDFLAWTGRVMGGEEGSDVKAK